MIKAVGLQISTNEFNDHAAGVVSKRNYAVILNSDLQIRDYVLKKFKDNKVYINQIRIQRAAFAGLLTVMIDVFLPFDDENAKNDSIEKQSTLRNLLLIATKDGLNILELEKTLSTFSGLATTIAASMRSTSARAGASASRPSRPASNRCPRC